MRRIALAAILFLSACFSDPSEPIEGTTGDAIETESGSDETSEEDESGESGGMLEEWTGEAGLNIRTVVFQDGLSCEWACGLSICVESFGWDGFGYDCNQGVGDGMCTCADEVEVEDATHVVSECYLNPNSGSRQAVDPPLWSSGTCSDFCGSFGLECGGTVWSSMKTCPDLTADDWEFYPEGPTTRPDDIEGPDGTFVVLCEV